MAQEAHEAPVGGSRSSSSTSRDTGMWESPRQMRAHTPFPSWIPYAGTLAAGAGLVAAADSSLPSERCPDDPDRAWNQSAPSVGARDGGSGYRGNYFQSLLDSKNVTPEMFEDDVVLPAASSSRDYLGVGGAGAAASDLAAGPAVAYGLLGSVDPYYSPVVASSAPPVDHETASSPLVYSGDSHSVVRGTSMMGCMSCYDDHEEKRPAGGSQRQGFGAPAAAFLPEMIPSRVETKLQSALGYLGMVSERLESSFGVVSLPDAGSFSDDYNSNRSSADFMSSNSNRLEQDIKPGVGGSSSGSGAATRRKSDGGLGGNTKKSKQEASPKASSPPKPQVPKVKVGEKITALQQIVSPFGKTDTSSVLFETIEYIKFLHEQIRMFSEPYMTKSTYKGHIRLRGEEKEEESGTENGLWGRGLCLVPVSLTSQAYHDDTLPDCWAPAYRGCLYR